MAQLVASQLRLSADQWPEKLDAMADLPSPDTPLYHHSLPALERWLIELGAVQQAPKSCHWHLEQSSWRADIALDVEELAVSWRADSQVCERRFPYGLSRADAEAAIMAGP